MQANEAQHHGQTLSQCGNAETAEFGDKGTGIDWYDETFGQSLETCGSVGLSVMIAGGVFLSLSGCLLLIESSNSFRAIEALLIAAVFGGTIGFGLSLLGQFVAMFLVAIFNAAIGFKINARQQILMTGGLAAFFVPRLDFRNFNQFHRSAD